MIDLRYPIGKPSMPETVTAADRAGWIDSLATAPSRLRGAVAGLTDGQLDTPYRPDGWTVRQVVHHLPDSHMNAFIRCKLALTEDNPTIKPYPEDLWADLPDAREPIAESLRLLDALHARWVALLRALPEADFGRTCYHPGSQQIFSLDRLVSAYAWHGSHHIAHITGLRQREGW
ncbi:MAG: putative metal-dependent hydrolase [Gemmatimonadetes bacterium]|nr:putative metal-dependent hydrolase [Gemmatimonadota bacterium]